MFNANSNKRARRGQPKRSSFADDLNCRVLPAAVNLLQKLDDVDFGNFESQLQPIADGMGINNNGVTEETSTSTLLKECMKFLVLKKIAGDEDATTLSPTDRLDAVWHKPLLNPRLYKSINDAFGGEMINHNPEGERDVAARNERVRRTLEMYKTVFVTNAIINSRVWNPNPVPVQPPTGPGAGTLIYIRDQTGAQKCFRIGKSASVRKIKEALGKRLGVDKKVLGLLLDGQLLDDDELFADHDLEDGDQLDLLLHQSGC